MPSTHRRSPPPCSAPAGCSTRAACRGKRGRHRRQPGLDRPGLRPRRRSARPRRRRHARGHLRPAARVQRRPAGEHDRDAARARARAHRVKVYSLYSETREPTPAMLDGLDVLVVDLQDVGTRIYTFIYTMAYCLTGAAQGRHPGHRVRSAQSDRRRRRSKGRCSSAGFESFVGLYPIPMRHGLTIGELARLFNDVVRARRRPRPSSR